ncbi:uncharacterized protein LOC116922904 [Daphnia magna]|nr:uncharacterized protein LOC116922904 [Daphnia magna]
MKKLDVRQILAERNERKKREMELNGFPTDGNDSLPMTPSFSDSILIESSSQGYSSQSNTEKKLNSFSMLDIFDEKQIFRLFSEDAVNFSWLDKDARVKDVPKMSHADLKNYLQSEILAKHCRRSHSTSNLACRYLFFLMSATASKDVMQTCLKILQEKISDTNEPFSVLVPDLLVVLMNYGTLSSKLWSDGNHISFPRAFRVYPLNSFDSELNRSLPFPRLNLEKVLSLLRFNITTYPYFSESEKGGLLHLMLNLSMANFIVGDTFLILIIRDIICAILESFRAEEWTELDFKMVEELALQCWSDELDAMEIVQRISFIPTTTSRGVQLRQSAAFLAIQHLMDLEEITVCGRVLVEDVYRLVLLLSRNNFKNYRILFGIVTLFSFTLDSNDSSLDKEKMTNLYVAMNEARHRIRDISDQLDTAPMLVKNLMCEVSLMWKDSIPIENVVIDLF